jgi:hypothetical protein
MNLNVRLALIKKSLLWVALGVNMLILFLFYLEASEKIDIFYFEDDCSANRWTMAGWAFSWVPMIAGWLIRCPIPQWHWLTLGVLSIASSLEAVIGFFWGGLCDGLGPLFG